MKKPKLKKWYSHCWSRLDESFARMARDNVLFAGADLLNRLEQMTAHDRNWLTFNAITQILSVLPFDLKLGVELLYSKVFIITVQKILKEVEKDKDAA